LDKNSKDVAAGIREKIAGFEKDFNAVAGVLFATQEFAKTASIVADLRLQVRKAIEDHMARQLERFNLPSRDDIAALGERMMNIDDRLIRVEEMLQELLPRTKRSTSGRPPRTKKKKTSKAAASNTGS
jgi:hypothetical protein